jgi:long-subunit fatty acid transport protein
MTWRVDIEGEEQSFAEKYKSDFDVRYPMWVGTGLAYRDFLFDGLTVTADLAWTRWSNIQRIHRNIVWTGEVAGADNSDIEVTPMKWEDTIEFALGFDYRLGRSIDVSLGYRNSPSPSPKDTYDFVMPSGDANTIGLGVAYRQDFWRLAAALEYRAGDEMTVRHSYDMNGKHLTDLLAPSLSLTYAF